MIRIIREEDEPKPVLMKRFTLTELQADTILDTRLRSLRKLEEMEIRTEFDELSKEKSEIEALLGSVDAQWKTVSWEIREVRKQFGPDTKLGKRRTTFGEAADVGEIDMTAAMVEREPITVVISEKGWVRALKGVVSDLSTVQFKGDDRLKFAFASETTAKILIMASNGKVFTIEGAKLPGGRGFGDPVNLHADIEGAEIVAAFNAEPGAKYLVATNGDRGFVVPGEELVANTKKGKQILNVDDGKAAFIIKVAGDHVAVIGENRKLLCFPLSEVPEMARGKGVRLQKYKDGGIADVKTFNLAEGLTWKDSAGRTYTVAKPELDEWLGARAEAGRLPPKGFPKKNSFTG